MANFLKKFLNRFSKRKREAARAAASHPVDTCVSINGNQVEVGKYTYGVGNIELAFHPGCPTLRIGRYCSIAGNVRIFLGAYHRADWGSTYPFGTRHTDVFGDRVPEGFPHSKGPVVVGNDVWIGNSVTIMSGISIGDGAVLAANAHVTKDVRPYEIVGGNPARHLKWRFAPDAIQRLHALRWWELEDSVVKSIAPLLCAQPTSDILSSLEDCCRQVRNPTPRPGITPGGMKK